jgi:oligopeptide/dipeptide ABC transporter ATP-binding protein
LSTDSTPPLVAEPLLAVEDLTTRLRTSRGMLRVVDGVTFELAAGRTLGVAGESGSGKTMLSRSIMGLVPPSALREGRVVFDGRDISVLSPAQLSSVWGADIAMVFQNPMSALNPVLQVGRQIAEPLRRHLGMGSSQARATTISLLRSVGIPEPERRFSAYPHQLSGGMRQRAAIAIALAGRPRLLLADEPTTALDVTVEAQILDLLAGLQQAGGMTMMLVTHDLGILATRTDIIAVMYAGRIVEMAPTRALFADVKMPYTEALIASTPRLANPPHTRLAAIPGRPPVPSDRQAGCPFAPRCRYAQQRCRHDAPPLRPASTPGHVFACWYPVGTAEGRAALEANAASEHPQPTAAGMTTA